MEHRSAQLKISGEGAPEVEKLQNGRYRLEFRCTGFSKTDWYANYSEGRIFADFGSLMDAEMVIDGVGGSNAIPDSVYPDMRLRENRLEYTPSGTLVVYFAYETLTDTFVQVKDDNVDYELNGLRRVTRPLIAKAGTSYAKVVGTDTISHSVAGGATVTLTLGAFSIDNDDAATTITETWLEAGTLSKSNDYVGSQEAIVIQAIGEVPATPSGYSLAKTDVSDFEGYSTNSYTFLKDGAVMSRSRDSVGSQQAVVFEVFNGTPTTADANTYGGGSGYVIANEQESDVDGVKTTRYTFLEPSILSRSEDAVGSQKAIVIEAFGEVPSTPTGYSLARTDVSDFEGYSTNSYTFLKSDTELSRSNDYVGSQLAESIEVFNPSIQPTPTVAGAILGSKTQSDVGGIPTIRYTFLNAGATLSTSEKNLSEGVKQVTIQFFETEGVTVGPVIARETRDVDGIPTISVTTLQDKDGNSIVNAGTNLAHSYDQMVGFTYPGVVEIELKDLTGTGSLYDFESKDFKLSPPTEAKIKATTYVFFQNSNQIVASDYIYDGAIGFWNPTEWARGSAVGIGWNYAPFSKSLAFRGYRSIPSSYSGIEGGNPWALISGTRMYFNTAWEILVTGGPQSPDGKKFVLDVKISTAFDDVVGSTYYKKIITVATIPTQGSDTIT